MTETSSIITDQQAVHHSDVTLNEEEILRCLLHDDHPLTDRNHNLHAIRITYAVSQDFSTTAIVLESYLPKKMKFSL
jgi:hypothetical protein